jgi:hypothetical protein
MSAAVELVVAPLVLVRWSATPAALTQRVPSLQVLREGEWSEAVGMALEHLGCWLLDDSIIDFSCPALDRCLHQPTAPGVLAALAAAMQRDPADFAAAMHSLQPVPRRHLRAYMLQAKWFTGGCLALCMLSCSRAEGAEALEWPFRPRARVWIRTIEPLCLQPDKLSWGRSMRMYRVQDIAHSTTSCSRLLPAML